MYFFMHISILTYTFYTNFKSLRFQYMFRYLSKKRKYHKAIPNYFDIKLYSSIRYWFRFSLYLVLLSYLYLSSVLPFFSHLYLLFCIFRGISILFISSHNFISEIIKKISFVIQIKECRTNGLYCFFSSGTMNVITENIFKQIVELYFYSV